MGQLLDWRCGSKTLSKAKYPCFCKKRKEEKKSFIKAVGKHQAKSLNLSEKMPKTVGWVEKNSNQNKL